jgi:hypothetical protein
MANSSKSNAHNAPEQTSSWVQRDNTMKRLIAATVLAGALSGCAQLEALLTATVPPQVQTQLDEYEAALAVYDEQIRRVEDEAKVAAQEAKDAIAAADFARADAAMQRLETLQTEHAGLVTNYTDTAAQSQAALKDSVEGAASGVLGMLDPVVPIPLQPLVPALSSLLVMAGSRRSRQHTKRAIRHAAAGNLGTGVKDLLKAVGATHSSEATKKVAEEEGVG